VKTHAIRDRFMPWAGLALGTTGYFIFHQLGSDATFQDCRVGSPLVVIIAMIIGLAMAGLGAFGSFGVFRNENEAPSRRLISVVSLLACALFAMATILPFLASMIIPRCWA
jgi:TctA family transporter